jgi:hypothetical protein
MGGACSTRGREEAYTGFWWGTLKERVQLEDPGANGRIILSWMFRHLDVGCMDWIDLLQDRNKWWALVNAVMNIRVPNNAGNFLTS